MAEIYQDVEKTIRKLRKKLRQIENLETLDRELNEEELDKVLKKGELRGELGALLREFSPAVSEMKRNASRHTDHPSPTSPSKIARVTSSASSSSSEVPASSSSSSQTKPAANHHPDANKENVDGGLEGVSPCPASSPSPVDPGCESAGGGHVLQQVVDNLAVVVEGKVQAEAGGSVSCKKATAVAAATTSTTTEAATVAKTASCQPRPGPSTNVPQLAAEKQTAAAGGGGKKKSAASSSSTPAADDRHKRWRSMEWDVDEYEGHEDLITDCDIDPAADVIVTSSRDTTVRVWSLSSGSLVYSLRGHTGSVTGVRLLSREVSRGLGRGWSMGDGALDCACVSGSEDCSLRVWSCSEGQELRSYYTYNGITTLQLIPHIQCCLTGTDGGKLEMFSLATGTNAFSLRLHDDAVTATSVKYSGDLVYLASGSRDGIVKLFQVLPTSMKCLYVSENINYCNPDSPLTVRPIFTIIIGGNNDLYYGDDGCNIKAVDWRNNRISKIANHTQDLGFTDSMAKVGEFIVASTFDLDTGVGGLNIFAEKEGGGGRLEYVATLSDGDSTRICKLCVGEGEDNVIFVTCGQELKVWKSKARKCSGGARTKDNSTSIRGCVSSLSQGMVLDSGTDESDEEEEEDDEGNSPPHNRDNQPVQPQKSAGFCNCQIIPTKLPTSTT